MSFKFVRYKIYAVVLGDTIGALVYRNPWYNDAHYTDGLL
jgi:hypothetical protein